MKAIPVVFLIFVGLLEIFLDESPELLATFYVLLFTAVLIIYSTLDSFEGLDKFVFLLSVIPLMRVLELLVDLEAFWKSIVLYSLFLFLGIYYLWKFKVRFRLDKKSLWVLPLVIVIGGLLGILGNILFSEGYQANFYYVILLMVLSEETFFRGLMQNFASESFGHEFSIIFVTLFYAILSSFGGLGFMFFFVVALFSCVLYDIYDNLILSGILNLTVFSFIYLVQRLA